MITGPQIKKLHALKNALGLTEDVYRDALAARGLSSCKDLSQQQARELINAWEQLALQAGVWEKFDGHKKFKGPRPEKGATPAQLRMVEAMWASISRQTTTEAKRDSLEKFIKRITKRDRLEWCTHQDVVKLTNAMKAMGAKQPGSANG